MISISKNIMNKLMIGIVNLQEKINEIYNELDELEEEQRQLYIDAMTSCDDQDEADDWEDNYYKGFREDLEDLEEDLQRIRKNK